MTTSFGALCTDFYINQELSLKMDLPGERETVLGMFDRVRTELPSMERFHRYTDELALESPRVEGEYRWLAMRRQSIRTGHVNPPDFTEAYRLHRLILQTAPYFLSISPLDVDCLELLFGFDLECKANQHEIVHEALVANSPLAELLNYDEAKALDVQPVIGMALSSKCDVQAFFEVKTRTTHAQVRRNRYRTEPISIFLTIRRYGTIKEPDELLKIFDELAKHAEHLAQEKVVPNLLMPVNRAIINSP